MTETKREGLAVECEIGLDASWAKPSQARVFQSRGFVLWVIGEAPETRQYIVRPPQDFVPHG